MIEEEENTMAESSSTEEEDINDMLESARDYYWDHPT